MDRGLYWSEPGFRFGRRHRRQQHAVVRRRYKQSQLLDIIRSFLLEVRASQIGQYVMQAPGGEARAITKERLAVKFNAYEDQVELCLRQLNLEGLVSQARRRPMAGRPGDWLCDPEFGWAGDVYDLLPAKPST